MIATFTWIGMDELKKALLRLPVELTELAQQIVVEAAEGAAAEIKNAYPEGETGNLKKGVRVRSRRGGGPHTVIRDVVSSAPHAWLFENGSQTRQTALGYNRGFMPGANLFVPVAMRRRREMLEDLVAIVEQAGLDVRR